MNLTYLQRKREGNRNREKEDAAKQKHPWSQINEPWSEDEMKDHIYSHKCISAYMYK